MAVGGPALVEGALRLTQIIGLSQGVVGATIVSLGTGAEMIALGVSAVRKKRSDILVGGILGSFAYNLLVTLGLAASIHALPVDPHVTFLALPIMIVVHLLLLNACLVWEDSSCDGRSSGGSLYCLPHRRRAGLALGERSMRKPCESHAMT
jgi:cation:H+ antiporter